MTADFSNLSPVGSDPAQFHGLIGVTLEGDPRLLDPSVLGGGDSGTVTSVGLSVPTGLAVTGSPVTTSGTIALTFASGYGIPTTVRQSEWDTAFGWGNHAVAGYLLSSTAATTYQPLDGDLTAIGALAGTAGLLRKTAANTWSLDTATYLQSAEIGSTILAYDANLQSFVNTFTLPTADGTSGQVLTTNGAGVVSFASPSTGTGFDFIQSTAPTITADGQVWLKPTDGSHPGTAGVWLSRVITTDPFVAYWVTSVAYESGVLGGAAVSATTYIPTNSPATSAYLADAVVGSDGVAPRRFYDYIRLRVRPVAGTFDGTNFWTFEPTTTTVTGSGFIGAIASFVLNTGTFDGNTLANFLTENVVVPSTGDRVAHILRAVKSGAAVNITSTVTGFKWRNIHP